MLACNQFFGKSLVLMYLDFPVALCDRGRWSIVKDEQQLQNWYDEVRLVYTWQERE